MTYDKMTDVEQLCEEVSRVTGSQKGSGRTRRFVEWHLAQLAALQSAAPVEDDVRKVLRRNRKALEGIPKQLFVVGDLVGLIQDNAALIERLSQAPEGKKMTEVEPVIRDLAKQLYAHHVIKYDPAAEERCIQAAVSALTGGVTQADVGVTEAMLAAAAPIYHRAYDNVDCDEKRDKALTEIFLAMLRASQASGEGSDDKETA